MYFVSAHRWWQEEINLDKADLTLVGFSKGCVVLNQLLYEFHYLKTLTPDDDTMMRLVNRIHDIYWWVYTDIIIIQKI